MTTDNIVGIALGIMSLVIAAIMFYGGYAEGRRTTKSKADLTVPGRGPIPE